MGRVLLTRPLAQQAGTRGKLEAMGHEVIAEPLLRLEDLDTPTPKGPFAGVLLTSINAVPAAARAIPAAERSTCPVLATGQATANAARAVGFNNVHHVDGNALDLAATVNDKQIEFAEGLPLLAPRAETVARDLAELVTRETVPWLVYRMTPATKFSDEAHQAIVTGKVDAVLLTSPLIARTFATLFAQLSADTPVPAIFAMSNEIRSALPANLAHETRISERPNESALLDTLATHIG